MKKGCRHKWALKPEQCDHIELDSRPDSSSLYTAAALCMLCRCHIELTIDFKGQGAGVVPCPKEEAPLHHFIYIRNEQCGLFRVQEGVNAGSWMDTQCFGCSSLSCSARLTIRMRSPIVTPEWEALLLDKSLIKSRAQKAISDEPSRFEGHAVPSPIEVVGNLRTYIRNAMTSHEQRRIPSNNKKWLLCFGEPCADLLQHIGFTRTVRRAEANPMLRMLIIDVKGRWLVPTTPRCLGRSPFVQPIKHFTQRCGKRTRRTSQSTARQ